MRMVAIVALAMVAMALPGMAGAATPAFNCARAAAPDEAAICRNPGLAKLDRQLAEVYREIKACSGMQGQGIQQDQIEWLASRRQCGGEMGCLARAYVLRIGRLAPDAARARKAARAVECPIF